MYIRLAELCARVPYRRYLPPVIILLVSLCSGSVLAQQTVTIPGVPYGVQSGAAHYIGRYNPQQMLRLVLALQPPHMQEEEEFLRELQDPNSPQFHQFLTQEEWNARFAPSAQDELAVVNWAISQGLTITQRFPNRLLVDVEAPIAAIEKAFNVSINEYQVGTDSKFSNDRDPSIPASLENVIHAVLGLNNIAAVHSFSNIKSKRNYPVYSPGPAYQVGTRLQGGAVRSNGSNRSRSSSQSGLAYPGYNYTDVAGSNAYNFSALNLVDHCCNPLHNPEHSPRESSIAIAIWGDFSDGDIAIFASSANLAYNVQRYQLGGPVCCEEETTLDVEWATAMSNSFDLPSDTAKVHVYEGPDPYLGTLLSVLNNILSDGHARVLNMSWGAAERYVYTTQEMDSYHAVFNQMLGQGWSLVAAAGDWGSTSDCLHVSAFYPSSDPDVTSVGGTTLAIQGGRYTSEVTWTGGDYGCRENDGGTGGGCSSYFAAGSYQGRTACSGNMRSVPDISLNSNWVNSPQDFVFEGFWYGVGGTSIAAPEMAGFFAQENAYLLYIQSLVGNTCGAHHSAACAPVGPGNPILYSEGLGQFAPHYPFYDITSGCNNNDVTQQFGLQYYCAAPGYDHATGWGSANMLQLGWMMNHLLAADGQSPSISIDGPMLNHWYTTDQTLNWSVTDNGGNGRPPIGVAGATFWWDNDPGDAYSEPTPGSGNGYYGPWSASSSGTARLSTAGQGCHYVRLRGWDNSGKGALSSYGPVCFDNVPPQTMPQFNGNCTPDLRCTGPLQIVLQCNDGPGSGCATQFYNVDQTPWQRYTSPFWIYAPGHHCGYWYSTDVAGNTENYWFDCLTILSNTQYTVSVVKSGNGGGVVTSSDGTINCGSTCSASFWLEQPITLTATPNPGSLFIGWRNCDRSYGRTCTATVTGARTITAVFNVPQALQFLPITPCRVVDTRWDNGPFGGPILQGGETRSYAIPSGPCAGIPANAAAYSVNAAVVPNGFLDYLTTFASGFTRPFTATLNSYDGRVKAGATVVPAGDASAISVYASQTTHVVIDINGYFIPANGSGLEFFPLASCRVVDTRNDPGPLGGPYLQDQQERDFPVRSSDCNIPDTAQAYSLNFAVIPRGHLGYLTAWPSGQEKPYVSTLNAPTGTVVANAAVVPAGQNGDISVFPFGADTDLIVDINGYFAPHNSGSLRLYTFAPCRVFDSRDNNGQPFTGQITVNVVSSPCQVPASAQAYVMNATAVPSGFLDYLTLWADGQQRPFVATLNAYDGAVTSNMAIVPQGNHAIDAYATQPTHLILDISSYFAP